jgi:hypothetical protein
LSNPVKDPGEKGQERSFLTAQLLYTGYTKTLAISISQSGGFAITFAAESIPQGNK